MPEPSPVPYGSAPAPEPPPGPVDQVLAGLSLRQRVGQLNQRLYGWRAAERRHGRWVLTDELHAELDRWQGLGALYGLFRADPWSGRSWADGIGPDDRAEVAALVQDAVRAAGGSGLGTLLVEEAPHGHQALGGTLLPSNLAQAASWDPGLVAEAAAAVAEELSLSGVSIALVSGLDLLRDPRWGRAEECFGEDPRLAADLCRAVVVGMQGEARSRLGSGGVGVVLKHLAAQGEGLGGRNGQSAIIGERDLRELHLPAAAVGVAAGAVGVMAAYNDIDGVPCCANPWLLRTWLREEQGFDGIVMADGGAVDRLTTCAGDVAGAGALALRSGVDLSLWDVGFTTLADTAERDEAVADAVTEACGRVLRVKHALGLLAGPRPPADPAREVVRLTAARERTATVSRRLAAAGLVLLTGDGAVPVDPDRGPVVVAGPNAQRFTAMLGDYVPPVPDDEQVDVATELRRRLPSVVPGPDDPAGLEQAVATAGTVVVVLGGTSHRTYADAFADNGAAEATAADCGEGVDRADLTLPDDQDALLRRIRAATRAPVVGVVIAGRPHLLTTAAEVCDTLLWAGYPGPYGAAAVVDALLGETRPGGALPFTLLRDAGAVPVRHNDRHHPGVYADARDPVLWPLGSGAPHDPIQVSPPTVEAGAGGAVAITAEVANFADRPGERVLIATVTRHGGMVFPRLAEVVAYRRVRLAPGERRTERWTVAPQAFFDLDGPGPARTVLRLAGHEVGPVTPG